MSESEMVDVSELRRLEPIFYTTASGPEKMKYADLMAPDFWEIGASGRRYERKAVLTILADREHVGEFEVLEAEDFECHKIEGNSFLVRYLLRQGPRITRRCSIWQRRNGTWVILYHQGTLIQVGPQNA